MFEDLVFITHYLQQKKKNVLQTIFVVKRLFAKKKKSFSKDFIANNELKK